MVNRHNKLARLYRKLLIKAFFGKCWFCGKTEDLEFFHIKPTKLNGSGRGFYARMRDIINFPCNYGLADNKCHNDFDNGKLNEGDFKL